MRTELVVIPPPLFDLGSCIFHGQEPTRLLPSLRSWRRVHPVSTRTDGCQVICEICGLALLDRPEYREEEEFRVRLDAFYEAAAQE